MLNLFYSYDRRIENAYIITVKGNEKSEGYSKRCQDSCREVGMPYKIWDAYDAVDKPLQEPVHLRNDDFMRMIKVKDHYLTKGELACALSHISLWAHCVKIDKPIVILEHDAVMVKPFLSHECYNGIVYLGGREWAQDNWEILPIPPHASEGPNYHFICRAHAYAIDPAVAKNLCAYALKMGACAPLDIMIRTDLFTIVHYGLFAYDLHMSKKYIGRGNELGFANNCPRYEVDHDDTTIKARPKDGRSTTRNDNLED
jgi:hypothetical protein